MSEEDRVLKLVGGRILCSRSGLDGLGSLTIANGLITEVQMGDTDLSAVEGHRVVDLSGGILTAGFTDLHTETGEPGHEHKEDLETMGRAAAHGGFTAVCASPITTPVNDSCAVTRHLIDRAGIVSSVRVLPVAALTVARAGLRLTEMFDVAGGGAVAFGDGSAMLPDSGLMRRALEYARAVGVPVFETPVDGNLARDGVMHEGEVSTRLGLAGIPSAAEDVATHRAVILAEATGARVHIGPISTAGSVAEIRLAKARGVSVTTSVIAAHLHLTDEAVAEEWSPHLNVRPPFRNESDRRELLAGILDGTIDAISSGHSPQSAVEKDVPFGRATPGMSALETTFGLMMRLVESGDISLNAMVKLLTTGPERVLVSDAKGIEPGSLANLVAFDPTGQTEVSSSNWFSRSLNTPFLGQTLPGRIDLTVMGGRIVYSSSELERRTL